MDIYIQIRKNSLMWLVVNPVCTNKELNSKFAVCFEYTNTSTKSWSAFYVANSIIGPVKAGMCVLQGLLACHFLLSWQPNFMTIMKHIHYFEHFLVKILSKYTSS